MSSDKTDSDTSTIRIKDAWNAAVNKMNVHCVMIILHMLDETTGDYQWLFYHHNIITDSAT